MPLSDGSPLGLEKVCDNIQTSGSGPFLRHVVCRKCDRCIRLRSREWQDRCLHEIKAAPRTWLVTLTYRGNKEIDYDAVQKYLKRLRKGYSGRVRFVAVAEKGSKGQRLHYHLLLHCGADLTYRRVCPGWRSGFIHAKIADAGSASYVAKYAAKDPTQRIRASTSYGTAPLRDLWSHEMVKAVFKAFPEASVKSIRYDDGQSGRIPFRWGRRLDKEAAFLASLSSPPECSCKDCNSLS